MLPDANGLEQLLVDELVPVMDRHKRAGLGLKVDIIDLWLDAQLCRVHALLVDHFVIVLRAKGNGRLGPEAKLMQDSGGSFGGLGANTEPVLCLVVVENQSSLLLVVPERLVVLGNPLAQLHDVATCQLLLLALDYDAPLGMVSNADVHELYLGLHYNCG